MDFWFILGVILKMAFILGVALLLYAPVFVLFERRQSAYFQDRLGPYMGGVKMPRAVIDNLPMLQMGGYASAAGAGVFFCAQPARAASATRMGSSFFIFSACPGCRKPGCGGPRGSAARRSRISLNDCGLFGS